MDDTKYLKFDNGSIGVPINDTEYKILTPEEWASYLAQNIGINPEYIDYNQPSNNIKSVSQISKNSKKTKSSKSLSPASNLSAVVENTTQPTQDVLLFGGRELSELEKNLLYKIALDSNWLNNHGYVWGTEGGSYSYNPNTQKVEYDNTPHTALFDESGTTISVYDLLDLYLKELSTLEQNVNLPSFLSLLQSAYEKLSQLQMWNNVGNPFMASYYNLTPEEYTALEFDRQARNKAQGTLSVDNRQLLRTLNNYNNNAWWGAYGTGSSVIGPLEESYENAKHSFENASLYKMASLPYGFLAGLTGSYYGWPYMFTSYAGSLIGADIAQSVEPNNPYAGIIGGILGGTAGLGPKIPTMFGTSVTRVPKGGASEVPTQPVSKAPGGLFTGSRYTALFTTGNGTANPSAMRHGPHFLVGSRLGGSTAPRTARVTNTPYAENTPMRGSSPKVGTLSEEAYGIPPFWPVPVNPYEPVPYVPGAPLPKPETRYEEVTTENDPFSEWFEILMNENPGSNQYWPGDPNSIIPAGWKKIIRGGSVGEIRNTRRRVAIGSKDRLRRKRGAVATDSTTRKSQKSKYIGNKSSERRVTEIEGGVNPKAKISSTENIFTK